MRHSPQEIQKEPTTKIAGAHGGDGGSDLDDGADVLVAHALFVDRLGTAVGPQVGSADARGGQLDDGVCGFQDGGHRRLFDGDVAGFVHDDGAHGAPRSGSRALTLSRRRRFSSELSTVRFLSGDEVGGSFGAT